MSDEITVDLPNVPGGNGVPKISTLMLTQIYPTNLTEVGLNILHEFKKKYNCRVGLSDHSGTIYPSLSVIAKQDDFLEVHVKLKDKSKYPDKSSSLKIDSKVYFPNSSSLLNLQV